MSVRPSRCFSSCRVRAATLIAFTDTRRDGSAFSLCCSRPPSSLPAEPESPPALSWLFGRASSPLSSRKWSSSSSSNSAECCEPRFIDAFSFWLLAASSCTEPAVSIMCLPCRLRRRAADFSARSRRSFSISGRSAKSSSSSSSSTISARCCAVTVARFCADISSSDRLTALGSSCTFTSGTRLAFMRFACSCFTLGAAVAGKGCWSLSAAGMSSRKRPRAFSTQSSHSGMTSSRHSLGGGGSSSPATPPPPPPKLPTPSPASSSSSSCRRRVSWTSSGPRASSSSRCSSHSSRVSAMASRLPCSILRVGPTASSRDRRRRCCRSLRCFSCCTRARRTTSRASMSRFMWFT
mmetsp:Transcript_81114/g.208831  ORF Transcript_81114/g.208831 Transcript_81114/m.208831 type:complete len:351 (+) Transcript_81114:306-1358(+)